MTSLAHDTQWIDAIGQAELVSSGKVTPLELLDAAIERAEQLNPAINALTFTWFEQARDMARNLHANASMPLRGVPFILKDLHAAMNGFPLSNGNKAMKAAAANSNYTAEIVQRFINAGLIIFGRGNSPEFGSLPTTEPEAWGPTRNPWDLARTPGGSSGGSASAVAAGIVPIAHASDGGGSIRIPAACCGLVGLKVSQGRISMGPYRDESNLGVEHCVSRTVRDSARLLDATHGPGIGDVIIAPTPRRPFIEEVGADPGHLRIGMLDFNPRGGDVHADCVEGVHKTARLLESLGHHVEPGFPDIFSDNEIGRAFSMLWSTNMGTAIRRFSDALGREMTPDDIEAMNWAQAEFAKGVNGVDFSLAQASSILFRRAIQSWWTQGWDLLLTPTLAAPPLPIGSMPNNPARPMTPLMTAGTWVSFTAQFNISGQPAISLPLHRNADGLPIGMQLVAAYGCEDVLIRVASQLEQATPWAHLTPNL